MTRRKQREPSNVVRLITGDKVPIHRKKGSSSSPCRHHHVSVDFEHRTLECDDCHRVVDPFEYFELLVHGWTNVLHYRREARRLHARLRDLEAEERRVKARLKRARARLDAEGGDDADG